MGNVVNVTTELKQYLEDNDLLVKDFAAKAGLKPWDISRLLSGKRERPSPRIALGIEKATGGQIPFRAWFEDAA